MATTAEEGGGREWGGGAMGMKKSAMGVVILLVFRVRSVF